MTTLIIITIVFLAIMIIVFAEGIVYTCYKIQKLEEDQPAAIAIVGMVSVLGLIWSIVSLITFYKIIL